MKPVVHDTYLKELTLRGVLLGALITVIFTASNVYLGLKVGMTFSTSIPAAVISMALLRILTFLKTTWYKLRPPQQVLLPPSFSSYRALSCSAIGIHFPCGRR